jgi:L-malate glycosyltransferase
MGLKKILIISNPLKEDYGGGERFLENLVTGLSEYEFTFIGRSKYIEKFFKSTNRFSVRAFFGFEPVTLANLLLLPVSFIASLFQFLRFIKHFKEADIILLPAGFTENFTLYPWLQFLNKKVVQIVHSNRCPKAIYKSPLLMLFKVSWNFFNTVFVSSSQLSDWHAKNIKPSKSQIIYNGVVIKNTSKTKLKSEPVKIGYLGRLHKEKGVDLLINSLPKVEYNGDISILIAGDGPERSYLQQLRDKIKVDKIKVEFLGFQSNPESFLESLDVLVFPSYQEGFSLVLLEALERGLPVIVSDLPSFMEVYKQLPKVYQELVFRKGDGSDLTQRLNYYLKNLQEFKSDKNTSHLHNLINSNFSVSKMLLEYKNLFQKL